MKKWVITGLAVVVAVVALMIGRSWVAPWFRARNAGIGLLANIMTIVVPLVVLAGYLWRLWFPKPQPAATVPTNSATNVQNQGGDLIQGAEKVQTGGIQTGGQSGGINLSGKVDFAGRDIIGRDKIDIAINQAAATAPLISLHQIPEPVGDFVGRGPQIDELVASLKRGGGAAIAGLSGMAGIGKSQLAQKVASAVRDSYPDAQLMVDLRGTDPSPLKAADGLAICIRAFVGGEIGLPESSDDLGKAYRDQLTGKRALILLDNAYDAAQIAPFVPPAGCALLVTSREAIPCPGMRRITLEELLPGEAIELIRCAARRKTEDETAGEISNLCGYLPLALRTAGSLLGVTADLTPEEYASQLQDETTRLQYIGTEGVPLGVAATFDLSYRLLPGPAQGVFQCLSVFPGSFDGAAEQAICRDSSHSHLTDLLRRSLVLFDKKTLRYRLHDLVRLFALGKQEQTERMAAELRHAAYYETVLRAANDMYKRGGESLGKGLALFDAEWRNVQAGQAWAAQNSATNEEAAKLCSSYPEAGAHCLDLRQHPSERVLWLEVALGAAKQLKDRAAEAAHLANLGNAYYSLGDYRKAIELHEQALAIAREIGDRRGEGQDLGNLGNTYNSLGEYRKATEFYNQHLKIAREIGDQRGEGNAFGNLGVTYHSLGEYRKATEFYNQHLKIAREMGDRRGEGAALGNLGNAYDSLGEYHKAIEFHEQHLKIAREIGDRRGEGNALGNLGNAYDSLGDYRKAVEFYEKALEIDREIGDRCGEGNAWGNLGNAYNSLGDYRKAIEFHEHRLKIAREIGDRRGEGNAWGNLGNAYNSLGDYRKAIEFHEQNLEIAREIGDRRGEGNALFNMSITFEQLGERGQAISKAEAALKILEQIESPHAQDARRTLARWRGEQT
jgi:tetratricopeptide (TPR) repeat protein